MFFKCSQVWKNTQKWMTGSLILLLYCSNLCTGHMYHYTRTHSLFAHLAVGLVRGISLFKRPPMPGETFLLFFSPLTNTSFNHSKRKICFFVFFLNICFTSGQNTTTEIWDTEGAAKQRINQRSSLFLFRDFWLLATCPESVNILYCSCTRMHPNKCLGSTKILCDM